MSGILVLGLRPKAVIYFFAIAQEECRFMGTERWNEVLRASRPCGSS